MGTLSTFKKDSHPTRSVLCLGDPPNGLVFPVILLQSPQTRVGSAGWSYGSGLSGESALRRAEAQNRQCMGVVFVLRLGDVVVILRFDILSQVVRLDC